MNRYLLLFFLFASPLFANDDFFAAAIEGDTDLLSTFLDTGVDVNLRRESDGRSAVALAALECDANTILWLVERDADVNLPDQRGFRPLHHAAGFCGRWIVDALIEAGADMAVASTETLILPNRVRIPAGSTPLHTATRWGRIDNMKALIEAGAPIDAQDEAGQAPIHVAAHENRYRAVTELTYEKADLTLKDNNGFTPLARAVVLHRVDIARNLLGNNAHPLDKMGGKASNLTIAQFVKNEGTKAMRQLFDRPWVQQKIVNAREQSKLVHEYFTSQKPIKASVVEIMLAFIRADQSSLLR